MGFTTIPPFMFFLNFFPILFFIKTSQLLIVLEPLAICNASASYEIDGCDPFAAPSSSGIWVTPCTLPFIFPGSSTPFSKAGFWCIRLITTQYRTPPLRHWDVAQFFGLNFYLHILRESPELCIGRMLVLSSCMHRRFEGIPSFFPMI